jgi:Fic family protein
MRVNQNEIKKQVTAIKEALKNFSGGASIDELMSAPGLDIELRTLQRRLKALRESGVISTSGGTRSTRYYLVEVRKTEAEKLETMPLLPLSDEGKNILALVTRPQEQRIPVNYHREFLEFYKPNITSYLTKEEKEKLKKLGKTQGQDQPAGTYAKQILQRLMIDLSYNSSRLEGNTYSLLDTERLIKYGTAADDKSAMEAQMVLNHKDAIEFMVQSPEGVEINRYTILSLHALLSNNLLPDPASSGRLRTIAVGIGRSVYTPLAIPQLIEEMFELILEKARQVENPFEQAFFLMVHLPYLQPFEDVNKRVSRLAVNIPLNRHNLSPLSFAHVPDGLYLSAMLGVYELNRVELLKDVFIWAYERSSARYAAVQQTLGEPDRFKMKYREEIKELVSAIVSQGLGRGKASELIRKKALEIQKEDQARFIEYVDTELWSLHEGNFARYWIRPQEFKDWKENWDKKQAGLF